MNWFNLKHKEKQPEPTIKGKCEHEFGKWAPYGSLQLYQRRVCKLCGWTQESRL